MNSGAKFEYLGYSPGVLQRLPASDRADKFHRPVFRKIELSIERSATSFILLDIGIIRMIPERLVNNLLLLKFQK